MPQNASATYTFSKQTKKKKNLNKLSDELCLDGTGDEYKYQFRLSKQFVNAVWQFRNGKKCHSNFKLAVLT